MAGQAVQLVGESEQFWQLPEHIWHIKVGISEYMPTANVVQLSTH